MEEKSGRKVTKGNEFTVDYVARPLLCLGKVNGLRVVPREDGKCLIQYAHLQSTR